MGLYQVSEEDVLRFAREYSNGKLKYRGDEVVLQKCPYCRPDDKYTFSINKRTGQFECKRGSCHQKGNMITLSRDFGFSLGREADAYYHTADYSMKTYTKFRKAHVDSSESAIEYMKSRGISEEITRKYELNIDEGRPNILKFPFRNPEGGVDFVKYRNLRPNKGQSKEFCAENAKPILFGMNQCQDFERLVITEGQIDSLSVAEAGIKNAVSVPMGKNGFTWIPYCYDWVGKFKKIVVFGDNENGIITLSEEIMRRWPDVTSVVNSEDYKGCKDANELLQKFGPEAVKAAVENAKCSDIPNIKPISQVKSVDIMKMEFMKTNMEHLDEVLDGGFRFGQLAILTGKRGDGKSTIASMWGVEALAQGYNCFFYSGELPDFYFRNWMDRQITKKQTLTQSDEDKLNQWYGERAFIYDGTKVDEQKSLLETIKAAIVQKNCRFILLDNLMTALSVDMQDDLYRAQSQFVGDLAAMAKKYVVFILLVAHPRKQSGSISNDDVSGSSNITDRADLTLVYGRPNKDETDDYDARKLEVIKNRLTGKLAIGKEAINLVYEGRSKRVAEKTTDFFTINYDWDGVDPYGFTTVSENDIPF